MSKTIKRFRKEPYGFFIDLDDTEASVAVDPGTGDILLEEGSGEDRFHGAAVSCNAVQELFLRQSDDGFQVVLSFGNDQSHVLGITDNKTAASNWIHDVIAAIQSHQHKESRSFHE